MTEKLGQMYRRLPALVIILISAFVIGRHFLDLGAIMIGGVDSHQVTLDFRTYMCGSRYLSEPYDHCLNKEAVSGFVYPPPSLIYFHALSRLPLDLAFGLHTLASIGCLALASAMLMRLAPVSRQSATIALIASLAIAPIGTSLVAGQVNIMVMAACVAAVYYAGTNRPVLSGVAVALGFWLKLYPGIVPALFLTKDKWRAVAASAIAVTAMAVASLLWASPQLYMRYFGELLPHVQGYTMPGAAQSITGMIAHIEAGGEQPVLHFVPVSPALQLLAKVLLAAGIVTAMLHQRLTGDVRPVETLSILLTAALVAAPNSWAYHYALIFPAIFIALAKAWERPSWHTPIVLMCWLALLVPGWTDPPSIIADNAPLNVLARGRFTIVALTLIALSLADMRGSRAAARMGLGCSPGSSPL